MSEPTTVIGLGEVLWDLLPTGRVLGGAPANFAYMATVLGNRGVVATRVGADDLGREALHLMQEFGLDTTCVQKDETHATGTATVSLDGAGQPKFTIKQFVAWDYLEWTPAWEELSSHADVICFGSLAQRSPTSATTIQRFLKKIPKTALCVCDINLRQSFYTRELVRQSLELAHIVKLNEQELLEVSFLLGLGIGTEEILAKRLLREFGLRVVCVTRGHRGSLLVAEDKLVEHRGVPVKVADAVGAGDAFAACLAHHYVRGLSLEEISDLANRFAAWVATQTGATPAISPEQLRNIFSDARR